MWGFGSELPDAVERYVVMYKYLFNFSKSRGHLFWQIVVHPTFLLCLLPSPPPPLPLFTVPPLLLTKMQNYWIFCRDQQTQFVKIKNRNCVPKAFSLGTLLSERQVLTAEKGNVNSGNHVIPCLWSSLTLLLNSDCSNEALDHPWSSNDVLHFRKLSFVQIILLL